MVYEYKYDKTKEIELEKYFEATVPLGTVYKEHRLVMVNPDEKGSSVVGLLNTKTHTVDARWVLSGFDGCMRINDYISMSSVVGYNSECVKKHVTPKANYLRMGDHARIGDDYYIIGVHERKFIFVNMKRGSYRGEYTTFGEKITVDDVRKCLNSSSFREMRVIPDSVERKHCW